MRFSDVRLTLVAFLSPPALICGLMLGYDAAGLWRTVATLLACTIGSGSIIYISYYGLSLANNPNQSGSGSEIPKSLQKYEKESITDLLHLMQSGVVEAQESYAILLYLRKKARDKKCVQQLVQAGLVQYILDLMSTFDDLDKRMVVSIDLLNEILVVPAARGALDWLVIKACIDKLISLLEQCHSASTCMVLSDEQTEVTENTKMELPSYCYKLFMALGSICSDYPRAQTRAGDRHVVKLVIACAFNMDAGTPGTRSDTLVKWGLYSLFNITFAHPPNKADLFLYKGLRIILDSLTAYPQNLDIVTQALALLLSLISDDSQAKFSLKKARQAALEMGIGDRLQDIKKFFHKERHVVGSVQAIMNLLAKNYS